MAARRSNTSHMLTHIRGLKSILFSLEHLDTSINLDEYRMNSSVFRAAYGDNRKLELGSKPILL